MMFCPSRSILQADKRTDPILAICHIVWRSDQSATRSSMHNSLIFELY